MYFFKHDLDKLLVIKDFYAHSVMPFLALHLRVPQIHVIDVLGKPGYVEAGVLMVFIE
ncbi:hypothetical protein GOM71_04895 [Paenibacillus sp. NEAU-GSW1]|nr:hypothetical protein [Paenibacillus sp. NEAU-GSW1]